LQDIRSIRQETLVIAQLAPMTALQKFVRAAASRLPHENSAPIIIDATGKKAPR
jgi:hypothetical protein